MPVQRLTHPHLRIPLERPFVPIPKRKREPGSNIDTEVVVSLKAPDTDRPIREGEIEQPLLNKIDLISTSKLFAPSGLNDVP
jgi:hypothetical protein